MGGGGRGRGGGRGGGGRGGINVATPSAKKNCQTTSKTARFTVDYHPLIQNKYFVFILSLKFLLELKRISIAYRRDVCHHINCCEFYHFDASVNWNQTQALIRSEPNKR